MQTIKLTPYENSLIGQYLPGGEVVVLLDTTYASFNVVLPDAFSTQGTIFTFICIGVNTANLIPITGQHINGGSLISLKQWDTYSVIAFDGINYIAHKKTNRFGSESNYSEFESDGTLVFNGDATVWDDLNFAPIKSGGPAASRPDDVTINNCFYKEFTSLNNQKCGDQQEIPHKAKLNSTFYGHAHCFLKSGESSGTTGVTFTVYWDLREEGLNTNGSYTLTATSAELAADGNKVTISASAGFAGSTLLGAQLALTLARTAGDAGDVIVTTYGIHYEIDQVGSREMTTK